MRHDQEYFRRRAAEARSAAFARDDNEGEAAGHLALAYGALARARPERRAAEEAAPPLVLSD